jgi:hypothetical protein
MKMKMKSIKISLTWIVTGAGGGCSVVMVTGSAGCVTVSGGAALGTAPPNNPRILS